MTSTKSQDDLQVEDDEELPAADEDNVFIIYTIIAGFIFIILVVTALACFQQMRASHQEKEKEQPKPVPTFKSSKRSLSKLTQEFKVKVENQKKMETVKCTP